MDSQAAGILNFQIKRDITSLYKRFLNALEDVRADHNAMVGKLEESLPSEHHNTIRQLDYFDDKKFERLRKRVLDSGNETIRGLEEQLTQFDVQFGQQG